jgi:hypothetical protein
VVLPQEGIAMAVDYTKGHSCVMVMVEVEGGSEKSSGEETSVDESALDVFWGFVEK